MKDTGLTHTLLPQAECTCRNLHPHSTQAQVNSPALSDQLKAFELASGNLLPPCSLHSLCPFGYSLARYLSLWQRIDVLRAAYPYCVAWHKRIDLSAKWYVVLLFPRARLRCALPSPLLTLPHTAAEGNVRMGNVAECCSTLSRSCSRSRSLSLSLSGCQLVVMLAPAISSLCHSYLLH